MWPFCGSQCDCIHVQYYLHRFCFFTTDSLLLRQTFHKDIHFTFGAGGFVCSLTEKELAEFHQHLESNFSFDNPCKVKKGLSYAGRQSDGVWVVNRELHISDDGAQIPLSQRIRGSQLEDHALSCSARTKCALSICSPVWSCPWSPRNLSMPSSRQ